MFQPSDFEISLEKQLRLKVINDEINNCNNIEELRTQLIGLIKQHVQYQQLLEVAVKQLIAYDIESYFLSDKIEVPKEKSNG